MARIQPNPFRARWLTRFGLPRLEELYGPRRTRNSASTVVTESGTSEHWTEVVPGFEVKMVAHPDGAGLEQFVLCRSKSRRDKEAAMLRQKFERLLGKLAAIDRSLRKRPSRDAGTIERRIGRWLGRYTGAETMLEVTVEGINILFIVAGLLLSVGLSLMLFRQHTHSATFSFGVGSLPLALACLYVFALRQGRPRSYGSDLLETLLGLTSDAAGSDIPSPTRHQRVGFELCVTR